VSVGPPIDLFVYRRDSMSLGFTIRLEGTDPYLRSIRDAWGSALHKAFQETVPDPGWKL
jgi:putative proteasome-type protease